LSSCSKTVGHRPPARNPLPGFANRAHAAHPAFTENVARLRSWGVTVLSGPGVLPPHDPGSGDSQLRLFPWQQAIEAIAAAGGISASRG
jgi:hypothetical protein